MHKDPSPRFQVNATGADGREHRVVVRSPASPSFRPGDLAKALDRAAAKGRRALYRKGIRGAAVRAVACLD